MRQREPGEFGGGEEIDLKDAAQPIFLRLGEESHRPQAGVVDEDVNAAQASGRSFNKSTALPRISNVGGHDVSLASLSADGPNQFFKSILIPPGQNQPALFPAQL